MRKFVAACCCAIVGLEILVAVPLVTCLVMFAMAEGTGFSPVAVAVHAGPALNDFPSPVPYNPAVIPAPAYGPPMICPPPPMLAASPPSVTPLPASLPPLSPEVEAIASAREQNGSPLQGTILDPTSLPPSQSGDRFVATLQDIAREPNNSAPTVPEPTTAPACPEIAALKPTDNESAPQARVAPQLFESLYAASEQLYAKANALESDGEYGRADEIRGLARRILGEIGSLRRESSPAAPSPSTVTAAAFNPQPPTSAPAVETVNAIEPSPTEPILPVPPDSPVEVRIEPKDPLNPAP